MRRLGLVLVAAAAASAIGLSAQAPRAAATCDRRCLLQVMFEYTEAITDNDISKLPLSPKARATNNGTDTALGKGDIWGPARRLPYRQVFVDPVTGAAIFYGVVTMSTRPPQSGCPGPRSPAVVVLRRAAEGRGAADHGGRGDRLRAAGERLRGHALVAHAAGPHLRHRAARQRALDARAALRRRRQVLRRRLPSHRLPPGAVASRVSAHRAWRVHGQRAAHGRQLRRRVPDPVGVVERREPPLLHCRRGARRGDCRRQFHRAKGISDQQPARSSWKPSRCRTA